MRTTQYALVLITQIVMLCAMLVFGAKVVDLSHYRTSTTSTSQVDQAPAGQGVDGLRQYLSR